jgi:class 3 adenylate cyclase
MADGLAAAHEAMERYAFDDAVTAFEEADRDHGLGGDDLRLFADATWWSGDPDAAVAILERAFAAYEAEQRNDRAALTAIRLGELAFRQRNTSVGGGWMARAERALEGQPEGEAHAWLAFVQAIVAMLLGRDFREAVRLADRAAALARTHGSRDAESMAQCVKGQALVHIGEWREGLVLLDGAAALATSGLLLPKVACDIYCTTIAACRDAAEYRRASEWAATADRWMTRHALRGYRGTCRAHRAELKRLAGDWPEAEREAREACQELEAMRLLDSAAFAYAEIGLVRLQRGDLEAAREALERAHEFGGSAQPGWSLLLLEQGKLVEAAAALDRALEATVPRDLDEDAPIDEALRSRLLPARVEVAVAAGDLGRAAHAVAELETLAERFTSPAVRAAALTARGTLELAHGRPAVAPLERAWRLWHETDLPFDAARARLLLARGHAATGDVTQAQLEARAALRTFDRLGARLWSHRAQHLLGELGSHGEESAETVTKVFLFTDIVASTELVRVIGDTAWQRLIAWHDRVVRSEIEAFGGEVVRHTGDGFFVAFDGAPDALRCAVSIQRRLEAERRERGYAPSVRIGLHLSEAGRHGGDYAGHGVHLAARIAALAAGDEVLASRATVEAAGEAAPSVAGTRLEELRGAEGPVELAVIAWRPPA